jgi:predicted O-methyltransferase YrrM
MKTAFKIFSPLCLLIASFVHADWASYKEKTLACQPKIQGWCSPEKASRMMDLIYCTKPAICVEIGVFGGSSVFPTACALKFIKQGVIYAIDPWANEECTTGYNPTDANYKWWNQVDLEQIYLGFVTLLRKNHLNEYCRTMRMTSTQAVEHFLDESIDIIHIDGNHSEDSALRDAKLFLPKVKKGGYIWFDDANWSSTRKATHYLSTCCKMDPSSKWGDPYLLFQKLAD